MWAHRKLPSISSCTESSYFLNTLDDGQRHCLLLPSRETTVTSLVAVLIVQRIVVMYPDYSRFSCCVPCSPRKFTGHGTRDMGCDISRTHLHFSNEEFPQRGYIPCRSLRPDKTQIDDPQIDDRQLLHVDAIFRFSRPSQVLQPQCGSVKVRAQFTEILPRHGGSKTILVSYICI